MTSVLDLRSCARPRRIQMRHTLLAAAAAAMLVAGGAATANADECKGGFKELANHVTVRCDQDRGMGFFASAPHKGDAVEEANAVPPMIDDDEIITGSIGAREEPDSN